jgi:hypothetical protein
MAMGIGAAAALTPVATTITPRDGAGGGEALSFQGVVDGTAVQGILRIDGTEVPVTAALTPEGHLSGTIVRCDGTAAGVFSAELGADRVLRGTLDLDGAVGTWSSPAGTLPVPTLAAP